jgi:MoCo/4Fe-4S cofactor protein with predicted Tat translocation signal
MTPGSDIDALRARLDNTRGRQYWRSLEALAETPEFKEFLHREFPQNASEWLDPVGRRNFLKLMGASLALAGVNACTRQPSEELVPYVRQPEELVPGKPLFYATAMPMSGVPFLLLLSRDLKRMPHRLIWVSAALLVVRYIDLFMLVSPEFDVASGANLHVLAGEHESRFFVHWLDLAAPLAIGGLWVWMFFTQLAQRPLLAFADPHLREALEPTGGH